MVPNGSHAPLGSAAANAAFTARREASAPRSYELTLNPQDPRSLVFSQSLKISSTAELNNLTKGSAAFAETSSTILMI